MYNMSGQVAIVTAGTQGIGRAIVDLLITQGVNVAVCARNEDRLAALQTIYSDRVFTARADLYDSGSMSAFIHAAVTRFGTVDHFFYNAPNPPKGRLSTLTPEDWDRSYRGIVTNLNTASQLLVPVFQRNNRGNIIVISSLVAIAPMADLAASSVVRAGLAAWVKLMAQEYGRDGIRVNAVLPGFTMTPSLEQAALSESRERGIDPEGVYAEWSHNISLKRLAKPEEIAHASLFLASSGASYITGTTLLVDGGMS